ncbi:MAG TPA: response regulator [Candidatus Melainabacteria bacterium]|nr:response regulator [Candidatus Melainabacteria bacterium]
MIAAGGYATFATMRQQDVMINHRTWLIQTYDVLLELEEIDVALEELLSSERGYILKQEEAFLKDFESSKNSIDSVVAKLRILVKDNPPQLQRVEFLKRTLDRRSSFLQDAINVAKTEGAEAAKKYVNSRGLENVETQADEILHEIISSEKNLLKSRTEKLARETQKTGELSSTLLALAASALAVCLVMVAYFLREKNNVAQRLAIQLAVTHVLSDSRDIPSALERLLAVLGKLNGFRFGSAWLVSQEHKEAELIETACWSDEKKQLTAFKKATQESKFTLGKGLPGLVWSTGAPQFVDITAASEASFTRKKAALSDGIKYGLGFPILGQKQLLGMIEFFSDKIDALDGDQMSTLAAFGQEIGQFVEGVRAKEELVERAELANFVAETAYVLSQQTNPDEMLKQCTSLMTRHLKATVARIWTISEDNEEELELRASSANSSSADPGQKKIKLGEGEIGIVAEKLRPLLTNELDKCEQSTSKGWIESDGLKSLSAYPLVFGKELLGVLAMYSKKEASRQLQETLAGVCNGIALGIKRSQSEQLLEERELLFRTLTEQIREVFIVSRPNASFVYISPAYEEIWGRPREPIYKDASEIFDGVHPEDVEAVKTFMLRTHELKTPQEVEHRVLRPDGSIRWIWARTFPQLDDQGELETIYSIGHDITDRKEAERRVSEFYSTVSHELRTPLTSIHASLRLIEGGLAGQVSDKVSRLVTIARNESDRLIRLINDILDIRKLEAGRLELKLAERKVADLVDGAFAATEGMAQEAKVTLKHQLMYNGFLRCDQDRVIQILTNFLSNAIKFSPEGETVFLDVEKHLDMIRFSVTDSGPGIPESEQHKLWGKFQQLDSSDTRPKGGTGLGLAITKGLTEQHGGTVGFVSTVGKGTTFWAELPVSELSPRSTNYDLKAFALTRVLMVEDDEHLTKLVRSVMKKEGFDVEIAHTLKEADEMLLEFTPKAIIMDVSLPDGNGLQWLKQKQSQEKPFAIPAIVLSGAEKNADMDGAPAILDWLIKPLEDRKLERALRRAVRNKGDDKAKVLVVEDDDSTRELIKHHVAKFPVAVIEATTGSEALKKVKTEHPDLIILDVGIPAPNGFEIVESLRKSESRETPLIVYTSRDLTKDEMNNLTLGLTRHLVKSKTTEEELVDSVKQLLDGIFIT